MAAPAGYAFNKQSWTAVSSETWLHLNGFLMDMDGISESPTEITWWIAPPVPGVEYVRVPAAFQAFALVPVGQMQRPRAKGPIRRRRTRMH